MQSRQSKISAPDSKVEERFEVFGSGLKRVVEKKKLDKWGGYTVESRSEEFRIETPREAALIKEIHELRTQLAALKFKVDCSERKK